jgi:hypothetical protein
MATTSQASARSGRSAGSMAVLGKYSAPSPESEGSARIPERRAEGALSILLGDAMDLDQPSKRQAPEPGEQARTHNRMHTHKCTHSKARNALSAGTTREGLTVPSSMVVVARGRIGQC